MNALYYRMMPEDSVYGEWPASGEIDIMESKGNDGKSYVQFLIHIDCSY